MAVDGKYFRALRILGFICFAAALLMLWVSSPGLKKINPGPAVSAIPGGPLDPEVARLFDGVYADDLALVQEQLDKGVDVNARNAAQETALHVTQNQAILELLIARGADVNARDDNGMTPLFNKDVDLARLLVAAGADIHVKSRNGNTPLIWYAYSGYDEGIRYLVSLGAEINARNADGQTAYDIADRFAHHDLADYLRAKTGTP